MALVSFPKSHSISKAIDKAAGRIGESTIELKKQLIMLMDASGKTRKQIDNECGFRATNYLTLPAEGKRPDPWVNVLPSRDKWQTIKHVIGCDGTLDALFDEAEREVIGKQTKARKTDSGIPLPTVGETEYQTWDITAPATEAAALWDGWGTALKPAWEPVLVCMKPLDGTFAANALAHGVAGLWIDGARVATGGCEPNERSNATNHNRTSNGHIPIKPKGKTSQEFITQGRWPANVALLHSPDCVRTGTRRVRGSSQDTGLTNTPARSWKNSSIEGINRTGYADPDGLETVDEWQCVDDCPARMLGEQSGERVSRWGKHNGQHPDSLFWGNGETQSDDIAGRCEKFTGDTGTAARFFYQAKASRTERNEGCEDFYWKRDGKQLVRVRHWTTASGRGATSTPRSSRWGCSNTCAS
jgi:hypothetical protein